jgi:hypothetical protein
MNEFPRNPPCLPEAVKKFRGPGNGKRSHVQGAAKIYLPKEALISFLSAVYELMPEGKWKSYFIYAG